MHLQQHAHGPFSRDPLDFSAGNFNAASKGQRLPTSSDVEDGQSLSFRFSFLRDVSDEPGYIINVHELYAVLQIAVTHRKHTWQTLMLRTQLFRSFTFSIGSSAKCIHHVVFYRCASKDMWA